MRQIETIQTNRHVLINHTENKVGSTLFRPQPDFTRSVIATTTISHSIILSIDRSVNQFS